MWDLIVSGARVAGNILGGTWDAFIAGARLAIDWALSAANAIINGLNLIIRGMNIVNPLADIPYVPNLVRLAHGGIAGGIALVGEHGPEIVRLPQGSSVTPAGGTRNMLDQSSGEQRIVVEMNLSGLPGDLLDLIADTVRVRGGTGYTLGIKRQ